MIQQAVPITLFLKGDGVSTTFVLSIAALSQTDPNRGVVLGAIPSSATIDNPPTPVTSAVFDANGNLTITLGSAIPSGVVQQFSLTLFFNSNSVVSGSTSTASHVIVDSAPPVSVGAVQLLDSVGVNKASISSGGALKVDGSAVTQPVSGSVSVSNFPVTQPVSGTVTVIQSGSPWGVHTKTALTVSAPASGIVGISSATVLAANVNRKGLHLVNTSANTISIAFGSSAVLNSGITLTPLGTFWMDEYSFSTAAVNAIASVASSNLAIQEYTT
jgi:hypothetical protein